jgi:hypothetical protein
MGLSQDEIVEKIRSGVLPADACEVTWYGPGSGELCRACGSPIVSTEVEVECDLPSGERAVRFHRTCFEAWDQARGALEVV